MPDSPNCDGVSCSAANTNYSKACGEYNKLRSEFPDLDQELTDYENSHTKATTIEEKRKAIEQETDPKRQKEMRKQLRSFEHERERRKAYEQRRAEKLRRESDETFNEQYIWKDDGDQMEDQPIEDSTETESYNLVSKPAEVVRKGKKGKPSYVRPDYNLLGITASSFRGDLPQRTMRESTPPN